VNASLLGIVAGLYRPTSGTVFTNGKVASLAELDTGFDGDLNGRKNIIMSRLVLGLNRRQIQERDQRIIDFTWRELKLSARAVSLLCMCCTLDAYHETAVSVARF
jgi:ABC-type polysaccharide/polyol phosphate transport system ATPase subunit